MFIPERTLLACAAALALTGIAFSQALPGDASPLEGARPDLRAEFLAKPDGSGVFFTDPSRGGQASELRLLELSLGRLVDVHALDAEGNPDPVPVFRDLVIAETIQTDGVNYRLSANLVTRTQRLLVLAPVGPAFYDLVQAATDGLSEVLPKSDDPATAPPFSVLPRNATLVARFDDLLRDSDAIEANLNQLVRVFVGEADLSPFQARVFFDPNHGGIRGGEFHSTRVVVDLTVDVFEESFLPLPINTQGLPEGDPLGTGRNVSLRLPSNVDPSAGQFQVLRNLAGNGLSTTANGPVDLGVSTQDVVRAARSGDSLDQNNGFLLDLDPPRILGGFPAAIVANDDATGDAGFDFVLGIGYLGSCASAPLLGDVVQVAGRLLEVRRRGTDVGGGSFDGVGVRLLGDAPATAAELLGQGIVTTFLRASLAVPPPCWVSVTPFPGLDPATPISTTSSFAVRFSEPVLDSSVDPFDSLQLLRGPTTLPVQVANLVPAEVVYDVAFTQPRNVALLPLGHVQGNEEPYQLRVAGITDLSGLTGPSLVANFRVDAAQPTETSDGVVFRFSGIDEVEPIGGEDLRGNAFFDLAEGTLRGRPATYASHSVDAATSPVQSLMIPFAPGIRDPLNPLGSKVQAVWRYADFGFQVEDETKFDLDVVGLNWAPSFGQVIADFFPEFEIRLSHGRKLPDEDISFNLLPNYPNSGLETSSFDDNVQVDPRGGQQVVHPRALGYTINPADLFLDGTGRTLMPFPLNQRGDPDQPVLCTWRDTSFSTVGAPGGAGVPLDVEVGAPLFLESDAGSVAGPGEVPSIGLPLLMEFRTYPTDLGIGLNALAGSLAINSSVRPHFRAFSSGGVNVGGAVVLKDPDLELAPSGGFNPGSIPPGQPTQRVADNYSYGGQLDTVVRESRMVTAWVDTGVAAPDYVSTLAGVSAPGGSGILVEYRGASGFLGTGGSEGDASTLDAYGNPTTGSIQLHGSGAWEQDIDLQDGARYFQIRVTFVNDIVSGDQAILDDLVVTWR